MILSLSLIILFIHRGFSLCLPLSSKEKKSKTRTRTQWCREIWPQRLLHWRKNPKEIWDYMHAFDVWYSLCRIGMYAYLCGKTQLARISSSFPLEKVSNSHECMLYATAAATTKLKKYEFYLIEFPFLHWVFYEFDMDIRCHVAWKRERLNRFLSFNLHTEKKDLARNSTHKFATNTRAWLLQFRNFICFGFIYAVRWRYKTIKSFTAQNLRKITTEQMNGSVHTKKSAQKDMEPCTE